MRNTLAIPRQLLRKWEASVGSLGRSGWAIVLSGVVVGMVVGLPALPMVWAAIRAALGQQLFLSAVLAGQAENRMDLAGLISFGSFIVLPPVIQLTIAAVAVLSERVPRLSRR